MKNPTSTTIQSTSSTPTLEELEAAREILTIDRRKIPYNSGFSDYEARLHEAICLSELLKELVAPSHKSYPDHSCQTNTLVPYDSVLLQDKAREGLGYIVLRISDVLQEGFDAIYNREAEVSKSEVSK